MTVKLSSKIQLTKLSDEVQDDGYAFEAVILSGEPIDHWHRFVVDLSSITPHKPRLTVDYNHNDELIIGYGENFHVTPEGLKSTGKLTPGSFADEIIKHWKAGVPFEASVVIDLNNAVETRVGADSSTVVNGRTYQGPISVYANVPLEGFSICPHGADKFTTFTLLSKELNFMTKTKPTPKGKTKLSEDKKEKDENLSQEETPKVRDADLDEFCKMFGEKNGLVLFQSGADIAEAKQWKTLNDKYSQYLTDDKKEEKTPDPPPESEDGEDDENGKLSAAITKLTKLVETQSAEIVKLKASTLSGGADSVSGGTEPNTELSAKEQYLASVRKRIKKS